MDNVILRKRLNTLKSGKSGQLRDVSNDVVFDVLRTWENRTDTAAELYRELGLSKMQLVTMIQKAKKLVKNGAIVESEFKAIAPVGAGPHPLGHLAKGSNSVGR